MELEPLPGTFAVCRLPADAPFPTWVGGTLRSVTYTPSELSIVCDARYVPAEVRREDGWRCLRVRGTLEFSQTGVLASLTIPLAAAGVSVFALSTFDTDYLLVKEADFARAKIALEEADHTVTQGPG